MDNLSDEEMARQLLETVRHGKEKLNREKVRRDAVQLACNGGCWSGAARARAIFARSCRASQLWRPK